MCRKPKFASQIFGLLTNLSMRSTLSETRFLKRKFLQFFAFQCNIKFMKKLGIIGAMECEVKIILDALAQGGNVSHTDAGGTVYHEGKIGGLEIVLAKSGVGKVNAALCAQRMILQFGADFIINSGIAGAMGAGLGVFDVVISSDALYHDVDATVFGYMPTEIPQMECSDFVADKDMIEKIKRVFPLVPESAGHKLAVGRIASGDQFVADKNLKEQIKKNCAPFCVEMEGAAVAHACFLNKTPFVIMRTLSDMADDTVESTYSFNEETAANLSGAILLDLIKQIQ